MSARAALRLSDVVKTYPGVVALKGVSFEVAEGEVHALVGENGAGKSTLMAVAAGSALPDSGSVEIGGRLMTDPSPAASQSLGLAVEWIYQTHLSSRVVHTQSEDLKLAHGYADAYAKGGGLRGALIRQWVDFLDKEKH